MFFDGDKNTVPVLHTRRRGGDRGQLAIGAVELHVHFTIIQLGRAFDRGTDLLRFIALLDHDLLGELPD